jgi:hypothetical protein
MTKEVLHQLDLNLSQQNTKRGFAKAIVKKVEVAFESFPSTPFDIDVMVVDSFSNWGLIFHKDLIKHLARSFQNRESKVIIPHLEGGFFTLYRESLVGSLVKTYDEQSDHLICINDDINSWLIQRGSFGDDTIETPKGI